MSLTPTQLSQLSHLLDEALDLEPGQVEPWLADLPAEHASLLPALRQMLGGRADSTGFMAGGPKLGQEGDDSVAREGELVGPYRLIREIGRGGMGAVWLAERADRSLKRQVALKLPRLAWGSGLAERMARERDIGALLAHPHIARLYDAGVDERGRPYLALEYIDGVPLDEWCRIKAPSIPERLRLFLQIARAVAYAHGRLVVHRDLKPSNVLVTADGQAHLLDFGIAKLLHEAGPGENLTQEQGRVLTPRYASPEQIRGETITVASDVYSLGVLLYEMLTGQSPHASGRQTAAAIEELILEGEPALASSKAGDKAAARQLRGELDAILTRSLRREPAGRYATADAFADDVERHLGGERVLAQPDSFSYRLRKALRRHRTAFAAGGAVAVAVLGGAGVSIVQAKRANAAAERASVVKEFVVDVFKVNSRSSPENSGLRQLPAQLLLERGANLIESKFAGRPELQAELYGVVAGIFSDMGLHRQGSTYAAKRIETLAAYDASTDLRASALLMLARELADDDRLPDAEARAARALELSSGDPAGIVEAEIALAQIHIRQLRLDAADRQLAAAEAQLRQLDSLPATLRVDAMAQRASWLARENRFDEALPVYEDAIRRALAAEGTSSARANRLRIALAYDLASRGRSAEAKPHASAAFAEMRRAAGSDDFATGIVEANLASYMLMNSGIRFEEALATITRVQTSLEQSSVPIPASVKASVQFQLGYAHLSWGDVQTAYRLMEPAYEVLRPETRGPLATFFLVGPLASAAMHSGHHAEASRLFAERLEIDKLPGRAKAPYSVYGYVYAAANEAMSGRTDRAKALLDSAPLPGDIQGASGYGPSVYRDTLQRAKARLELDRGRPAEALQLLSQTGRDGSEFDNVAPSKLIRGAALCELRRPDAGMPLLEQGIEALGADHYAYEPAVARWRTLAALCALQAGQRARAVALADAAREAFAKQPEVSPYYKAMLPELGRRLAAR